MPNTPKYVQDAMDLAVSRIRFESAGITFSSEQVARINEIGADFPNNHTEIVREATRLYMETWVVPLLQAVANGNCERVQVWVLRDQGVISGRKDRLRRMPEEQEED